MGISSVKSDVLIVGGGLSGLKAALTITELAPEKKLVIADLGGCASTEVMGLCAPMDSKDSVDCFVEDTMRAGNGENDPALVRRLCSDAKDIAKSLESDGIKFDRKCDGSYDMLRSLGSSFHRVVHYKTVTGKAAIEKYRTELKKCPQVEFRKSRIVKLFVKGGRIAGALGFENGGAVAYSVPGVILTTGGAAGLYGFSTWTKSLQGSGYALALDAGVELTGMKRVQFEPCVTVYPEKFRGFPIITTMLFEGAKLIDSRGREVLKPGVSMPAKRGLAELITAAVADGGDCGHGGVWFDFSGVEESIFKSKYPEYYKKLRPVSADYKNLRVEVKPAAHTTLGGIKISSDASTSLPGLFAAGEACGGIHGRDRIGGNAGLEIFVFGRAAGISAAAYKASNQDIGAECETFLKNIPEGDGSAMAILKGIGELLDTYAGVHRSEAGIAKCAEGLKNLKIKLENNPPAKKEDFLICLNALSTAEQLAQIAD